MPKNDLIKTILSDIKVELMDEFIRNFERKAFFDKPWTKRRSGNKGSLLVATGRLRKSLHAQISQSSVKFSSDCDYAGIHNSGGTIPVTPKMRAYFWHRCMQAKGDNLIPAKGSDAAIWSAMARAKKITIPQRQFIGDHPQVGQIAVDIANDCIKAHFDAIFNNFKTQLKND